MSRAHAGQGYVSKPPFKPPSGASRAISWKKIQNDIFQVVDGFAGCLDALGQWIEGTGQIEMAATSDFLARLDTQQIFERDGTMSAFNNPWAVDGAYVVSSQGTTFVPRGQCVIVAYDKDKNGKKCYALYRMTDLFRDIIAMPREKRLFYELLPEGQPVCLYLDIDQSGDTFTSFEDLHDQAMCIASDAHNVIQLMVEHATGNKFPLKFVLSDSSRRCDEDRCKNKISLHYMCKSIYFPDTVQGCLLERFVWLVKEYIGDLQSNYIDIQVYTKNRLMRILGNCKIGHPDRPLVLVNQGTCFDSAGETYEAMQQKLSAQDYEETLLRDLSVSMITKLEEGSIQITAQHIECLEKFIPENSVGMVWCRVEREDVSTDTATYGIENDQLREILRSRLTLTRGELVAVSSTMPKPLCKKNFVMVVDGDGRTQYFKPNTTKPKRYNATLKKIKRPLQPEHSSAPLAKKAARQSDELPAYFSKIFCDAESCVTKDASDAPTYFAYVQECINSEEVEQVDKYYIRRPVVCPYHWCTNHSTAKKEPDKRHRSNNACVCIVTYKDGSHANKRDCFAFCLDEQCRNEFLGKMKSAVSTLSEIMFPQQGSSVKIPNLVSKNEKPNVTFVQRYIKSPFALSKIHDGQDRADLAMLCKNDPRNLQRLLQGAEGGRRRQQLFLKFFNHRGWVPIAEHREDQAAFLPGRS